LRRRFLTATGVCGAALLAASGCSVSAACNFAQQGEGRVVAILDARTIRLDDGHEVRLAGIETDVGGNAAARALSLTALIEGRSVTLHAGDDKPDRYGRQIAVVFPAGSETSIQTELLSQGEALASGAITDRECSAEWAAAETAARDAKRGFWAGGSVTKNAEMPGDILATIGQFTLVEGTVLSARQAGSTFYVNFGRRWTRDFAVTISRRMMPSFEAAGLDFKSLEGRKIRVRGWVEKRGGPRIEATRIGQIEVVDAAGGIAKNNVPQDEGK
jgi:endonuclease YncB( thermonuclease family)